MVLVGSCLQRWLSWFQLGCVYSVRLLWLLGRVYSVRLSWF